MNSPQRTILLGGFLIGCADAIDAMLFFGMRGIKPSLIFQSIAAAVLGRDSFKMGNTSVALGFLLHYCVAFAIAAVFWLLIRVMPQLLRWWVVTGAAFGVAAYFVMNLVILPLTKNGGGIRPGSVMANGIAIHALLGLILAWFAKTKD